MPDCVAELRLIVLQNSENSWRMFFLGKAYMHVRKRTKK